MIVDVSKKILIVGLGLLGGSYARVLKRFGFHISAITKDQSSIDYAINENLIDQGSTELDEKIIGEADLVIFALYPHVFVEWIEKNQHLLKSGSLITDVTGVKGSIVYKIQDMLRDDVEFIAAHPMAGREVSGVENSSDKIFAGANYIVTPTEKNTPDAIQNCMELGRLLGFSNVATLSPEEHDEMIGFLSQLTHCIAVTLMTCNDKEHMEFEVSGDMLNDIEDLSLDYQENTYLEIPTEQEYKKHENRKRYYVKKNKVTYKMIQDYVMKNYGYKVHTVYIAEVKRKNGIDMQADRQTKEIKYPCPPEKVVAIENALKHFKMI
mgnify:CR=1 FL=1